MAAAAVVEGEVVAVAVAAEEPDGAGGGNNCEHQLATENQVAGDNSPIDDAIDFMAGMLKSAARRCF